MKYSKHFTIQAQRRGIDKNLIDLIDHYGNELKATRSAVYLYWNKQDINQLKHENPIMWKKYRDKVKTTLIISNDEIAITAMPCYKSHKKISLI